MADPNNRSRRRRSPHRESSYGPYDHPTLTPRGYELMKSSPLKDERYQMPLAEPARPHSHFNSNPSAPVEGRPVEYDMDGNRIIQIFPPANHQWHPSVPQKPIEEDLRRQGAGSPAAGSPGQYFLGRSSPGLGEPSLLQNTLPSKKFSDLSVLTRSPLTRYFKSNPARLPRVGSIGADASASALGPADRQLRAIGRMVIHVDDTSWDQPAFGSAWIVGPSLIATCAHNLFDSNHRRWSRAIEFYPGFNYYQAEAPIQCNVTSCYLPSAYLENPATNDDIAFCHVDRNIGDLVGAQIPIVPPENNHFFDNHRVTVMGYPAGAEFDFGKELWSSQGEYLFGRSSGPGDDYSPVMATNFGGGCSGCPWLAFDRNSQSWKAVGLSSGHARLYYQRGELNLMSLTSPMITQERLDRLTDDHVTHEFEQVT